MIYHQDYTIKLIQQFIIFLATLLKLKKKDDPEIVLIELEKAYSFFVGYPKNILIKMDIPSLIQLLTFKGTDHMERLAILGILFLEEANLYKEFQEIESASLLRKKGLEVLKYCINKIYDKELKSMIIEYFKDVQKN